MAIDFARPEFLQLLLLLPPWWALAWRRAGGGVLHPRGETMRELGRWRRASSLAALVAPGLLRGAAMACLILVLAGPRRVELAREVSLTGKAIGLVVDLSSSMLATDMESGGTRIDVARDAAIQFAEGRRHDELSLVAFAGRALTRVPPTVDPNLIVAGVRSLEIQMVGDGTDISTALLTSIGQLTRSELESRVVILLTDGAHNGVGVRPLAAARAAAALGIRVHSISVAGAETSARAASNAARRGGRSEETDMQTVLGGISELTGGRYFHASTGAALDSIYREINRIEAPVEEVTEVEITRPESSWLLLLALVLLAADGLLRGSRWGIVP